jgi:hypothetical protein
VRRRRRALLAVLAIGAGTGAAACSPATPDEVTCAKAPIEVVEVIATQLEEGMTLRNANIRNAEVDGYTNGLTYISAEMLEPGDEEDTLGEVLTWATGSVEAQPPQFFSVDTYAREHSSWPHANFNVKHDGAIESRGCVSYWAGEPPEVRESIEGNTGDLGGDLGFESSSDDESSDDSDDTTTTTARP